MAITLSDNIKLPVPKPLRDTDVVGTNAPNKPPSTYATKEAIPLYMRYLYMKVTDAAGTEWRLEDENDFTVWTEIVVPSGGGETTKPITASVAAGGISIGDLIPQGTDLTEFVEQIISPLVLPTVAANNRVTLNGITSTTMEVGSPYTSQLSPIYNRGSISSKNGTPNVPLTGPSTGSIYNGAGVNASGAISMNILAGNNLWSVTESYSEGTDTYYGSDGLPASNLDAQRAAGSVTDNSNVITGRYRWWWSVGSIPTTSAAVRALTHKGFMPTSTFTISIPTMTAEVAFYIPVNSGTVTVTLVESNADVTDTFTPIDMGVDDAAGVGQQYTRFETIIPGGGYTAPKTYKVVIS